MKKTRDEMLDHEFDGIREYDNPPPNWIMWMLYASTLVAVLYWVGHHVFAVGRLPVQKYELAVAEAAERQLQQMADQPLTNESLALMAQVPDRVQEGRQIFEQFCASCHLNTGAGSVGPNLTDPYWLHGGSPLEIHRTVTYGVPDKGMVAWNDQLGPSRVQTVVAYVLTLKGKNLPGKAPQGEPEAAPASTDKPGSPGAAAPAGASREAAHPVSGGHASASLGEAVAATTGRGV